LFVGGKDFDLKVQAVFLFIKKMLNPERFLFDGNEFL